MSNKERPLIKNNLRTKYASTIEGYQKVVKGLYVNSPEAKFLFRGVRDSSYLLNSSATRRLEDSGISKVTKDDLLEYHKNLLSDAKRYGLNYKEGHEIKDMELLADLQHHQCATGLIDFTRNPLIALFFATIPGYIPAKSRIEDGILDKDGAVYVIKINNTKKYKELTYSDSIDDGCLERIFLEKHYLFFWEPTCLNKRILAQHSVFILGEPQINANDIVLKIVIKNDYDALKSYPTKMTIQEELREIYNITNVSLFNDLPGFSYANSCEFKSDQFSLDFVLLKANEYQQQNNYNESVKYYTKYLDNITNNQIVYYDRGFAFMQLERFEEALKDFNSSLKLDSDDMESLLFRGIVNNELSNFKEAVADLSKVICNDQNNDFAYYNRGKVHFELNQYKEAIADFNSAIELGFNESDVYFSRGFAYLSENLYEQSIKDFDEAIKKDPLFSLCFTFRAQAKTMLGLVKEALIDYDKAIEIDSSDASAYRDRSELRLFELDDYNGSLSDINKSLEIDANSFLSYFIRSCIYIKLSKYYEAKRDIIKALELNPKSYGLHLNNAFLMLMTDDYEEALIVTEKVINMQPKNPIPYIYRSISYYYLNGIEKSKKDFSYAQKHIKQEYEIKKDINKLFNVKHVLNMKWKQILTSPY